VCVLCDALVVGSGQWNTDCTAGVKWYGRLCVLALCACETDPLVAWVGRRELNTPLRSSEVTEVSPADVVHIGREEDDVVEVAVGQPAPGSMLSLYRESWTVVMGWGPAEVSSGIPVLRMSLIPAVWYGKDLRLNVRLSRSPHRVQTYTCRVTGACSMPFLVPRCGQ
jgi:hypothetical protein